MSLLSQIYHKKDLKKNFFFIIIIKRAIRNVINRILQIDQSIISMHYFIKENTNFIIK